MHQSTKTLRFFRKTVGQNLHNLRASKRLTLEQFANMLNMRPDIIDRYEIGKNQISMEFLAKVAATFNTNIFRLVEPPDDYFA